MPQYTDYSGCPTEPNSLGSHNKTRTRPPMTVAVSPLGLRLSPPGHISLHVPKRWTGEAGEDGGHRTGLLHGPYVSADHKTLKPLLGPLLWNWKQEPVTAAAIASFGWVYGGSVRKAQSDGSAHADLLTAAGCRRLMSCCHSASSSLSWLLSDDACLLLSVSNLLMCLHVSVVIESLKWANRALLMLPFGCCNIFKFGNLMQLYVS